jgi:hypothetical protein
LGQLLAACFGISSFLDKTRFAPQVENYHPIEIPVSKKPLKEYIPVPALSYHC